MEGENEEVLVEEGGELEGFSEVDDNGEVVEETDTDTLSDDEDENKDREPTEEEEFYDAFDEAAREYGDGSQDY